MMIHYYGFEITPVSATEITCRGVFLFDPKMDSIPESLVNWGTKQFLEYMINKMIKFSATLKGTEYEKRLRSSENTEFYLWI